MPDSHSAACGLENRVLLFAPMGRDAPLMRDVLAGAGITGLVCSGMADLCRNAASGAGAAVLAAEALTPDDLEELARLLAAQQPWSDLPLIMLLPRREAAPSQGLLMDALGKVGNLNLLERPLSIEALMNAVTLALRARRRQYQARDHMRQLEEVKEGLAQAITEATRANEAKSRFLAAASHDLRQPFQAMRLYHQIVADALDGTSAHRAALLLGDAITSGEELLNALLDLSTLEAGVTKVKIGTFEIGDVIRTVANDLGAIASAKELRLRVRPCSNVVVRSDNVLLKRIVRNLTINAIRYTERGGVLIGCRERADHVLVQVWDTGIGIPGDKLKYIFEDFYQVNNPERSRTNGMGLGLSIVDRMARLLGHTVSVHSLPGRGSVFSVQVPKAAGA